MYAPSATPSSPVNSASLTLKVRWTASTRSCRRASSTCRTRKRAKLPAFPSDRPIEELDLGTRPTDALTKAGITNVGRSWTGWPRARAALLSIEGFGRKSLADLKKRLRQFGYELPEAAEEIIV